tara:strand:+ start:129 stop:449 length:321 start_codon:yes stop_codon:yes gene_type:complete
MLINMAVISFGGYIFEIPNNFNAMNWDLKYFIFPFLAHSLGTFSGALTVVKLSKKTSVIFPLIVGFYFLTGGIYMATILPAPRWFLFLDLIFAYIPMAFLAWKISK